MRLTKRERANIYCMAIAEIESPLDKDFTVGGFCYMLWHMFEINLYDTSGSFTDVPELLKQRPEHNYSFHWFRTDKNGWKQRKKCLLKALEINQLNKK